MILAARAAAVDRAEFREQQGEVHTVFVADDRAPSPNGAREPGNENFATFGVIGRIPADMPSKMTFADESSMTAAICDGQRSIDWRCGERPDQAGITILTEPQSREHDLAEGAM